MKKVLGFLLMYCLCMLAIVGLANADGIYKVQMDSVVVYLAFQPGPFGPGESGCMYLAVDGFLTVDEKGQPICYTYMRLDEEHNQLQTE